MGLDALQAFLRRHRHIGLDTSVFLYQLEANPRYDSLTDIVFAWLASQHSTAVTSTVTMTELLVSPYRDSQDQLVRQFYSLLANFPNLSWIAPDLEVCDMAARIRARHRLKTPDAIQAATSIQAKTTGFITNNPIFEHVSHFETLVLDRLLL